MKKTKKKKEFKNDPTAAVQLVLKEARLFLQSWCEMSINTLIHPFLRELWT